MLSIAKAARLLISTPFSRSVLQSSSSPSSMIMRAMSSYPAHAVIQMPSLSPTMAAGTIASWSKKVGDKVSPGDAYAEVETDKATMAFEAQEDGYIAKLLVDAGKEITVGTPILVIVEEEKDVAAFASFAIAAAPAAVVPKPVAAAPTPTPAPAPLPKAPEPVKIAPPASAAAPTPLPTPPAPITQPASNISSEPAFLYSQSWSKKTTVSVLAPKIRIEQAAYLAKFGRTGHKSV